MLDRDTLRGAKDFLLACCKEPHDVPCSDGQHSWPSRSKPHCEEIPIYSNHFRSSFAEALPHQNPFGVNAPIREAPRSLVGDYQCRGTEEAHRRSLAKAISWRTFASIDTFVLSFLITGNIRVASSISAVEIGTKLLLFYFHERIWALTRWGRR